MDKAIVGIVTIKLDVMIFVIFFKITFSFYVVYRVDAYKFFFEIEYLQKKSLVVSIDNFCRMLLKIAKILF